MPKDETFTRGCRLSTRAIVAAINAGDEPTAAIHQRIAVLHSVGAVLALGRAPPRRWRPIAA